MSIILKKGVEASWKSYAKALLKSKNPDDQKFVQTFQKLAKNPELVSRGKTAWKNNDIRIDVGEIVGEGDDKRPNVYVQRNKASKIDSLTKVSTRENLLEGFVAIGTEISDNDVQSAVMDAL